MSYYYMLEFTAQCKVLLHDRPCMTHACHHKDRHTIKAAYRLPYHTIPYHTRLTKNGSRDCKVPVAAHRNVCEQ